MRRARAAAAVLAAAALALVTAPRPAHAGACPPQAGECQSVAVHGSLAASIDIAIVGDGYTAAEKDKFFDDAQAVTKSLLASETYSAYAPLFNAWALFTSSAESGADDPSEGIFVDTAFDATFDKKGIEQFLVVHDPAVQNEVLQRFPESDLILCLVNSTTYGGSGGNVAVISLDPTSIDIARHELGHMIGGLGDEYPDPLPGFSGGGTEPNIAAAGALDPVKWDVWLTPGVTIPTPIAGATGPHEPVGAYEGALYHETGMFRPAPSCIMRELGVTFCPVCTEAMLVEMARRSLFIDRPEPPPFAAIPADGATTFTATIPPLDGLVITWAVDGVLAAAAGTSFALDPGELGLGEGIHEVTLTVYDPTPRVRDDPDGWMKESHTWKVAVDASLPANGAAGAGAGGASAGAGGSAASDGGGDSGSSDTGACACRAGAAAPLPSGAHLATWPLSLALLPLARRFTRRRRLHSTLGETRVQC